MFNAKSQERMNEFLSRITEWEEIFKNPQSINFTQYQYDKLKKDWNADIMHVKNIITISGSPGITRDLITRMIKFINKANEIFGTGAIRLSLNFYERGSVLQNIKKLNQVAKKLTYDQLRKMVEPTTLSAETILGAGDPGGIWNDRAKLKIKTEPKPEQSREIGRQTIMINNQSFCIVDRNKESNFGIGEFEKTLLDEGFSEEEFGQIVNAYTQRIFLNPIYLIFGDKESTEPSISSPEIKLNIAKRNDANRDNQVFLEATQKLYKQDEQNTYLGEITTTYRLNSDSSLQFLKITISKMPEHSNTILYDRFMDIKAKSKAKNDIEFFCDFTELLSDNDLRIGESFSKNKDKITEMFKALHQTIWKDDQTIEVLKENPKLRTRLMGSYDYLEKRECGLHNKIESTLNDGEDEKSAKTTYATQRMKHKVIALIQKRRARPLHSSNSEYLRLLKKHEDALNNTEKLKTIQQSIEELRTKYRDNSFFYSFGNWFLEKIDAILGTKMVPEKTNLSKTTDEIIRKTDKLLEETDYATPMMGV